MRPRTIPRAASLLGLAVLVGGARAAAQEARSSESIPATLEAASVRDARISPDGALVVLAAAREPSGTVELYSVPLDGGRRPIHVGGPLALSGGFRWEIAPDGRRVVYVGPELASVVLDGASRPVRLGVQDAHTRDFVLSPDGARVVHRAAPPGLYPGLFSVAADGSETPIELVAPNEQGEVEHSYQISPDGTSVVFLSHHEDGSIAKLYSVPIDGGPVVVLDRPRGGIQAFRISPDGNRVVYRCSRDAMGSTELYSVPVAGGLDPARLDAPLVPGDGVLDFEISPDGSWVAYLADRGNGRNALLGVPADGSTAAVELGGDVTSSFQIHPAGLLVLHVADREQDEQFELRGAAIDGSTRPIVLSAPIPEPGHVGWFAVAPDGHRLVYQIHRGDDQGGRISELWQVSLPDGLVPTRLAETGTGSDFRISPDGQRVFYRDEDVLYGLALDGDSVPVALASAVPPGEIQISPDGSRVLYLTQDGDANERGLASVRADGGAPVWLHSLPGRTGTGSQAPGTQASSAGGGFRDFSFGNSGVVSPTGEKPESKLWWNDGSWWGSLYVDAATAYHIHRLDAASQRWVDTGTVLDERASTNADVLWHGATQKLYVASHVFTTTAGPTAAGWGRLYRYSYNPAGKVYARDPGFPVDITRGSAEALTIARDSTGRLWATWVEASRVMVNHSLASDSVWRAPFALPAGSTSVSSDDISSIIAFGGNKVGVLWSNQLTSTVYFAVHLDGQEGTVWLPEEVVLPGAGCSGACADDHINMKADADGRVFAVLKTSMQEPDQPLNLVVSRGPNGGWNSSLFGLVRDNHTRSILLLEEESRRVHVFATSPTGGGVIYHKSASLTDLRFEPGVGTPFIQSATDAAINDCTSTKQNVNALTDIVVLACDENTRFYMHNFLDLGSTVDSPTISTFAPTSGPVGTSVTITGTHLGGATSVRFNGTPAAFAVLSDTLLRATVPGGATTGRISVSTPDGTATSSGAFTVTQPPAPPSIHSFSPTSGPVGTNVTVTGAGFGGTTGVSFNGTPASFRVVSSTQIQTTVPAGATSGRIRVTAPAGSASSASDFRVTHPPVIDSFLPPLGTVLTPVAIYGKSLSGATSVKFNGKSASFQVVNGGLILTSVPLGATTGRISVTTPAGTGTSATDFVVIGF